MFNRCFVIKEIHIKAKIELKFVRLTCFIIICSHNVKVYGTLNVTKLHVKEKSRCQSMLPARSVLCVFDIFNVCVVLLYIHYIDYTCIMNMF